MENIKYIGKLLFRMVSIFFTLHFTGYAHELINSEDNFSFNVGMLFLILLYIVVVGSLVMFVAEGRKFLIYLEEKEEENNKVNK